MKRKRVLKIFTLVLVLLIGWGFIWSWFITKAVRKNSKDGEMKNQHAVVKNIIVTETKEEKKYWEFYAKSGEYNSNHNQIELNDIIGNFYGKNNEVVLSFKSSKGTYDELTKKVVLNGDNLFVSKNGSQLYADKLVWQGNDKDILADGDVQFIMEDKLIAKAKSATFNSSLTDFKIKGDAVTKLYGSDADKKKYTQL